MADMSLLNSYTGKDNFRLSGSKVNVATTEHKCDTCISTVPGEGEPDNHYPVSSRSRESLSGTLETKKSSLEKALVLAREEAETLSEEIISILDGKPLFSSDGKARNTAELRTLAHLLVRREITLDDAKSLEGQLSWLAEKEISVNEDDDYDFSGLPEKHLELIGRVREGYFDKFLRANQMLMDFFKKFNDIRARLSEFLTPGDDGKVDFDGAVFKALFDGLLKELEKLPNILPVSGSMSKEEADAWMAQLGGTAAGFKLVQEGGGYVIRIDDSELRKVIDNMPGNGEMDSAEYNAWNQGFESRYEALRKSVEMTLQKLQSAQQITDNLYKLMGEFVRQYLEINKAFLVI